MTKGTMRSAGDAMPSHRGDGARGSPQASLFRPGHQLKRALAFARHMPLSKLARRFELEVRRRVRDRLGLLPVSWGVVPSLAANSPKPILPPRRDLTPIVEHGVATFRFLNRTLAMACDDAGPVVDWLAPGPGGASQLLRMNLHYMEYLEAASDPVFETIVRQWIVGNPAGCAGNWRDAWNSYALSLRVVVLMQQLARADRTLDDSLRAEVAASVAGQMRFLEKNLETDIGGNHLIKNTKALIWASAFFAGVEAKRWRSTGLALLKREIVHQVLADGIHYERSPSYHCQVFADLLECRYALGGDPLGGQLDAVLARMAQAAADLAHPDGRVAQFSDAGLSMAYAPAECLAAYERLIRPAPTPQRVFAYPQAGYFGLRAGGSYIVVDCGRIAPDDLPAHGHGDVLSFEWSVNGNRLVVDQGVFEYFAGPRREASRAAASHNTLAVDGADQADFFGAFRCGRRPNVEVRAWQPGNDAFELVGSHDGYGHLPGRPRHVRRIAADVRGLAIRDHIEGRLDGRASVGTLLHPDIAVTVDGNGHSAMLRGSTATVRMTASAPITVEPASWWPDMGVEVATRRLMMHLPVGTTTAKFHFAILDRAAGANGKR